MREIETERIYIGMEGETALEEKGQREREGDREKDRYIEKERVKIVPHTLLGKFGGYLITYTTAAVQPPCREKIFWWWAVLSSAVRGRVCVFVLYIYMCVCSTMK